MCMAGSQNQMSPAAATTAPVQIAPTPDPSASIPDRGYGYRYGSGKTPETTSPDGEQLSPYDKPIKGEGYYGMLRRKDGSNNRSSELSIGVEIGDKLYNIPSMAPGLNKKQIDYLLETPEDDFWKRDRKMMESIQDNAASWARKRLAAKLPVYATAPEEGKYKPTPEKRRQK